MAGFFGPFFGPYFGPFFGDDVVVAHCEGPTLAQARVALAARLYDPGFVQWTANELTFYLQEAVATWQVWTSALHATGTITLPMATAFIDLAAALPSIRAAYVTNWYLVTALQYTLLEPPAPAGTWTGTAQFTLAQITTAMQRRRDQFLRETGIQLTRYEITFASAPVRGRVTLPTCTLQVRRLVWRDAVTGYAVPLVRMDGWSASAFGAAWTTPGIPSGYGTSDTAPHVVQIYPPPANPGSLDVVAIEAGAALDPTVETALGIPNDYAWVLKYGVLADLLSNDGLALDAARAHYCEMRWQQGVELARRNAVCLSGEIQSDTAEVATPMQLGSLADADAYAPTWPLVAGVPRTLLLAGQNLIGIWPPAGGGATYTVTVNVVRSAPWPILATDRLEITPDITDAILDLAQHAALVKEGPGQVEQALPLLERAARAAGIDLALQQASQPARRPLIGQQQQDSSTSAYRQIPVPVEVN